MLSIKDAILPVLATTFIGFAVRQADKNSPQLEMPQVQFATTETNERIDAVLRDAMEKCIATGNMQGKEFIQQKTQILGKDAHRVRARCGSPRRGMHEFRFQIEDNKFKTRDGKRFDPVESLSLS